MRGNALKKENAEAPPQRAALRAVESKLKRPAIKVYTGSDKLKEEIEKAANDDRPNQSASAFLLGLFWTYKKSKLKAETQPPHE